jgi:hypothetical protein
MEKSNAASVKDDAKFRKAQKDSAEPRVNIDSEDAQKLIDLAKRF